jgi:hypothetical protein
VTLILFICCSAPTRPLGAAELLLEACFTDMRHGGDGDLTQAYKFAKKVSTVWRQLFYVADTWLTGSFAGFEAQFGGRTAISG